MKRGSYGIGSSAIERFFKIPFCVAFITFASHYSLSIHLPLSSFLLSHPSLLLRPSVFPFVSTKAIRCQAHLFHRYLSTQLELGLSSLQIFATQSKLSNFLFLPHTPSSPLHSR